MDRPEETSGSDRAALLCPLQGMEADVSVQGERNAARPYSVTDIVVIPRPSPSLYIPAVEWSNPYALLTLQIPELHSWDEWVPETRLLKWEDSNIKLQKSLIEAQRAKDRAEKEAAKLAAANASATSSYESGLPKSATSSSSNKAVNNASNLLSSKDIANNIASGTARGTKRGRDSLLADEDEYKTKPEVKIVIPDFLKVKLVDDWEAITKNAQVSCIALAFAFAFALLWYIVSSSCSSD